MSQPPKNNQPEKAKEEKPNKDAALPQLKIVLESYQEKDITGKTRK